MIICRGGVVTRCLMTLVVRVRRRLRKVIVRVIRCLMLVILWVLVSVWALV